MLSHFFHLLQRRAFKRTVVALVCVLILAMLLNEGILRLFGQKSDYRAAHGLVGIFFLIGFFYFLMDCRVSRWELGLLFLAALIPCYLGTVFPDWDIQLLGIGGHRNPLFHSGLSFFLLLFFMRNNQSVLLHVLIAGYGVGLSSHLFWDLLDNVGVHWLPGRPLGRFWLGANGLLCLVFARIFLASLLKKSR